MKQIDVKLKLFIVLFLTAIGPQAMAQTSTYTLTANGIGPVQLGMKAVELPESVPGLYDSKLSDVYIDEEMPDDEEMPEFATWYFYDEEGETVFTAIQDSLGYISEITISSPNILTAEGLHVGSLPQQVETVKGAQKILPDPMADYGRVSYQLNGITLWIDDYLIDDDHSEERVAQITIPAEDSTDDNLYKKVNNVIANVYPHYSSSNSLQEMETHINEIRNIDGVQDVTSDGSTTLNVYIKDFGPLSFTYPVAVPTIEEIRLPSSSSGDKNLLNNIEIKKIAIAYQFKYDHTFEDCKKLIDKYSKILRDTYKITVDIVDPTVDFYLNDIYKYDYVILCTHGTYDKLHYLFTTEGAGFASDPNTFNVNEVNPDIINKYEAEYGKLWEKGKKPEDAYWGIGCTIEKREINHNMKSFNIMYTKVSENMIRDKSRSSFNPDKNVIVFNAACRSFEGTNSLARVFIDKGASLYFGYDNENEIGVHAALAFLGRLISGYTVEGAIESLEDIFKHDVLKNDSKPDIISELKHDEDNSGSLKKSYCKPTIIEKTIKSQDDRHIDITVSAQIPIFHVICYEWAKKRFNSVNRLKDLEKSPLIYGFELSKTIDFSSVSPKTRKMFSFNPNLVEKIMGTGLIEKIMGTEELNDFFFTFKSEYHESTNSDFWDKNQNRCYVRAFVYDGKNYNYGEPMELNISVQEKKSSSRDESAVSNNDNSDESDYEYHKYNDATTKLKFSCDISNETSTVVSSNSYDGYEGHISIPSTTTHIIGYTDFDINKPIVKTFAVTKIEYNAFCQDRLLESVTIGENIEVIGWQAFCESGIHSIFIPDNVIEIGPYAFSECHNLKTVRFSSGLKEIQSGSFSGCTSLEDVTIPGNIERIESNAFSGCTNLRSITLEEGIKRIDSDAFKNCTSLTQISIPNSVESVYALCSGCTKLKYVSLGNGIKEMRGSFYNCPNLKVIVCHCQTPPKTLFTNNFSDATYQNVILYVPKGSKSKYQANAAWRKFRDIREGEPGNIDL